MANELSQYKSYDNKDEYFGHFATTQRLYDVMCTIPLVTPKLSVDWKIYKNDGTTLVRTSTSTGLADVEFGFKVNCTIQRWWEHNDDNADPDSANFSANNDKTLPVSHQKLSYSENGIAGSKSFRFDLYRTKTAPSVSNNVLIKPNGKDKLNTSVSCSVTFKHRPFIGAISEKLSGGTIAINDLLGKLTKCCNNATNPGLVTGRTKSVTACTTAKGKYFCYIYPKALGTLTKIIQDGATPIIDSFIRTEIKVINDAGATIDYYVYTSVNDGSFNNASVDFS